MNGMDITKAYFEEFGRGMIEGKLSAYREYIAAGLVGEGSECFGFDDELSRDHDFGPGFCIWVPQEVYAKSAAAIQSAYDSMPAEFRGYRRTTSAYGGGRVGVISIEQFYMKFTGLDHAPMDNMEWFRIPETFLATATNGQVFMDNLGRFSEIRGALKQFYPDDVLRKKLAARCVNMAQSGQYNYPRCIKRGDSQAAYFACGEFVKNAIAAIYLLNGEYMPYYKWTFQGAERLKVLAGEVRKLRELVMIPDSVVNGKMKENLIEEISVAIVRALNRRGLTRSGETFLQVQGEELMRSISDARLAGMHIMADA